MDSYNDLYGGPNYTRLFLLFILFLVSMYYFSGTEKVVEQNNRNQGYASCLKFDSTETCKQRQLEYAAFHER